MKYSERKISQCILLLKDTSEMPTIIDNSNTLTSGCRLLSFDIIDIFPSIDNTPGLKAVKSVLDARQDQFPPAACIIEALNLCLECNNSVLITNISYRVTVQHKNQGSHMKCSHSDIARRDLGMIFLLFDHIVLMNLIYFFIR